MYLFFKEYSWSIYLGMALNMTDITVITPAFYAVLIPTTILVTWSKNV